MGFGLLSFLTWAPIAGGLVVLLLGDRGVRAGRWVALATAVVVFGASIPLWTNFDTSTFALQFTERLPWIPALNSTYYLGIDGISLPLILLTTLITVPVIIAAWTVIETRPAQYFAAFLIMDVCEVLVRRRCRSRCLPRLAGNWELPPQRAPVRLCGDCRCCGNGFTWPAVAKGLSGTITGTDCLRTPNPAPATNFLRR